MRRWSCWTDDTNGWARNRRGGGRALPGSTWSARFAGGACLPRAYDRRRAQRAGDRRSHPRDAGAGVDLLRGVALRGGGAVLRGVQTAHGNSGHRSPRRLRRRPRRDHGGRRRCAPRRPGRAQPVRALAGRAATHLGRRGILVLGPPGAAQALARHPPRPHPGLSRGPRGRDAGGDPDGAAARREHRHGVPRDGEFRARRVAPCRPPRRLAQREGPHRRVWRQLYRR